MSIEAGAAPRSGLRPLFVAVLALAHATGALCTLAAMWSFLRSPFVAGEAAVALRADGYRPATLRVEEAVYVPPQLGPSYGSGEGSAVGVYYVVGTIDGSRESLRLGEAPPAGAGQRLVRGDEVRVLFNPALPHPRHEDGTGPRVRPYEPEFATRARERFRRGILAAYAPLAVLALLLGVLIVAGGLARPRAGRWTLLWLTPLVWLVPIGAMVAFQGVAATARAL